MAAVRHLEFQKFNNGLFVKPRYTSYMSSIETLSCSKLLFCLENCVFAYALLRQTDKQMDKLIE